MVLKNDERRKIGKSTTDARRYLSIVDGQADEIENIYEKVHYDELRAEVTGEAHLEHSEVMRELTRDELIDELEGLLG